MLDINPLTFFTSCQLVPTEHVREFVAVQTRGDGNSCFRAASFLLFGTNVNHLGLRLRTVCELVTQPMESLLNGSRNGHFEWQIYTRLESFLVSIKS